MHLGRRHRQLGVDGRGEGMHQLRPGRVVEPQRRTAFPAEIALAGRNLAVWMLVILDLGAKDAEIALALDLQCLVVGAEVDGETAAALLLAADRAVAQHERHRRVAFHLEMDSIAAAGPFEQKRHFGTPTNWLQLVSMVLVAAMTSPDRDDMIAAWTMSASPNCSRGLARSAGPSSSSTRTCSTC